MRAALAYFAIVFAAGFVLGTIRTLWVAPLIGRLPAVAVELPAMLGVAWFACGRLTRRFAVAGTVARLRMGTLAFALLMIGEMLLALAFGGTPAAFARQLVTPPGLLGLAGQLAFAAFPLLRR